MFEICLIIHLELGILNFHTNPNERVWKKALYWKWQLRASQQISGVPVLAIPQKNEITRWWIIHRYWVLKPLCLFFLGIPWLLHKKAYEASTYIYISLHYPYILYIYIIYNISIYLSMSLHGWDPETQVVFCQVTIRSCVPAESRPSWGWCHRWWNRKGVRPIVVGHFVQPCANFIINGLQLFVGWVTR